MLSSVLRSNRAIQVNIAIMRAFVKLHEMITTHKELARKLLELDKHLADHDEKIQAIFEVIRRLMTPTGKMKKNIGFTVKERQASYGKRMKKSEYKKILKI